MLSIDMHREMLRTGLRIGAQSVFDPPRPPFFAEYRGREQELVEDIFGQRFWGAQRAQFDALREHRFVAVRGGRKVSKTHTAACIVLGYLYSAPTIVITTAPTWRQVKEVLWQRIGEIHSKAQQSHPTLQGHRNQTRIDIAENHFAFGMTSNDPGKYRGWHAGVELPEGDLDRDLTAEELNELIRRSRTDGEAVRLLILIDEASSVPAEVINALEGSMSGYNVFVVYFANPTNDAGSQHPFPVAFRPGSRFYRIRITLVDEPPELDTAGFDEIFRAPNWLADPKWIEEKRRTWTEASPLWAAYVAGRFPAEAEDVLVPLALLAARADPEELVPLRQRPLALQGRHMGVDVARSGPDKCVALLVVDGVVRARHAWGKVDLMRSAGIVIRAAKKWGVPAKNIHIDVGMGAGIIDRLRELGMPVDSVDFGSRSVGDWADVVGSELRFKNRRTELFWAARCLLEQRFLSIPEQYDGVWNDLTSISYHYTETDELFMTPKKDLKKKLGHSIDDADALICALARGEESVVLVGSL